MKRYSITLFNGFSTNPRVIIFILESVLRINLDIILEEQYIERLLAGESIKIGDYSKEIAETKVHLIEYSLQRFSSKLRATFKVKENGKRDYMPVGS